MERQLPKNVRQIGNVSDNPKIYVEDYVDTYLNQLREKAKEQPVGVILVGEVLELEDEKAVFVSGAVQMQELSEKDGKLEIEQDGMKHMMEEAAQYFPESHIVGWGIVEEGNPMSRNREVKKIQEREFGQEGSLFLWKNAREQDEIFYAYKFGELMQIGGHYIYYEKNPEMQNYMINTRKENGVTPSEVVEDRAAKNFRSAVREKMEYKEQHQSSAFAYITSAVLVLIVLVIGITTVNNFDKMKAVQNSLETLSETKYVVFDKTGTMTQGVFEVNGVHHNTMPEEQLLEYAALAECSSSHPISKSLQKAYGKQINRDRVTEIKELSGKGVTAKVDGIPVAAGNAKLMKYLNVEYSECEEVGTIVHVAVNGKYAGHILISDKLKPHAKEAIRDLKKAGITKTVMLTGDMKRVADKVAEELGIGEVYSELLPADKVAKVEQLLSQKSEKEKLAFVGDGINDAPVLSRADIGIAMGALGSDAAIEAADVVLMDDDPKKIVKAIKISRKCMRIVYENIYFALGIKAICLVLGALGIANMWMAIFADVGVMVIAVLNAIRALFVKNL